MKSPLRPIRWAPSIAAVAAFAALGATGAYWALQLFAPPIAIAPTGSLVDTRNAPDLVAAQALFGNAAGETAVAAAPDVDIRVLGVAASPVRGSAVLVVDSRAPKAFLVGDGIGPGLRLVEVRTDAAVLERNGVRIELPAPQRPSVALLSSGPKAASRSAAAAGPADADEDARGAAVPPTAQDATRAGPAVPPADDPAIEAATLSPRGAPVADPARLSGIRASSVRDLGTPANAAAPPDPAPR